MERVTITCEGNVNDSLNSLKVMINRLDVLTKCAAGDLVQLDLQRLKFLGPDGATVLCGSILAARSRGVAIEVRWPVLPQALDAFMDFSGLRHYVDGANLPSANHPENVTVALRQFRESKHQDSYPILDLIARFRTVTPQLQEALEIAFNETVQNMVDHSNSPVGGLSCARYMTKDSQVRVSLMDWGTGILATLRRRYSDTMDHRQALQRVLFGGYSAQSRRNNTGRGIDNLRMVVTQAMAGKLIILSGNAAVEITASGEARYSDVLTPFGGTVVCFSLPLG